eukprot:67051-Chlamydomonas_euryale.AAC.5
MPPRPRLRLRQRPRHEAGLAYRALHALENLPEVVSAAAANDGQTVHVAAKPLMAPLSQLTSLATTGTKTVAQRAP